MEYRLGIYLLYGLSFGKWKAEMGGAVIVSKDYGMVYRKNETMFILGKNCAVKVFWGNEEVKQQIRDIAEARPYRFTIEAAADIFMLGYIYGKRAERARRKGQANEN